MALDDIIAQPLPVLDGVVWDVPLGSWDGNGYAGAISPGGKILGQATFVVSKQDYIDAGRGTPFWNSSSVGVPVVWDSYADDPYQLTLDDGVTQWDYANVNGVSEGYAVGIVSILGLFGGEQQTGCYWDLSDNSLYILDGQPWTMGGVNNAGDVAGIQYTYEATAWRTPGLLAEVLDANAMAYDINESGIACGEVFGAGARRWAADGTPEVLADPTGVGGLQGSCIVDDGSVLGDGTTTIGGYARVVFWDPDGDEAVVNDQFATYHYVARGMNNDYISVAAATGMVGSRGAYWLDPLAGEVGYLLFDAATDGYYAEPFGVSDFPALAAGLELFSSPVYGYRAVYWRIEDPPRPWHVPEGPTLRLRKAGFTELPYQVHTRML